MRGGWETPDRPSAPEQRYRYFVDLGTGLSERTRTSCQQSQIDLDFNGICIRCLYYYTEKSSHKLSNTESSKEWSGRLHSVVSVHQGYFIHHDKEHRTESSDKLSSQSKLFQLGFYPVASIHDIAYAQFVDAPDHFTYMNIIKYPQFQHVGTCLCKVTCGLTTSFLAIFRRLFYERLIAQEVGKTGMPTWPNVS